jgi:hypothetical protein
MHQTSTPGGNIVKVIIKEWPNRTATIMTGNGQVVWTFSSVAEARTACREWQDLNAEAAELIIVNASDDRQLVTEVA